MSDTIAPELANADALLARIDPALVPVELREAVTRAARERAFHREAAEAVATCEADVAAATDARALRNAHTAASALLAARAVVEALSPVVLDHEAVDSALTLAATAISAARQRLGDVPSLSYDRELREWRTLPGPVMATADPVITRPDDVAMSATLADFGARHTAADASARQWSELRSRPGAADPLAMLESAGGVIREVEAIGAEAERVTTEVTDANTARAEAGLTWQPPAGIDFTDQHGVLVLRSRVA